MEAQPKCLYKNAWSIRNKQEELYGRACLQGYDAIGITETWWDGTHNWNVGIDEYKFFSKDRQWKRGGGAALYINDHLESMELHLWIDKELTESFGSGLKGRKGKETL